MDFWYTFIFENKEHLEAGQELQIFEAIKRAFPGYIQFWFKTACKEIFAAACKQGGIPFKIDRIGTFWNKNEETVDTVSYTHLDVYKRQGYGSVERKSPL